MANADRGEVDITFGGQVRTLRFRSAEMLMLEEALGMDPLAFLAKQGGVTKFLACAIHAGLSKVDRKASIPKVLSWLDEYEGDVGDLQKQVLYAIARGKPGKQAQEMVAALDEAFKSDGPLVSASA